MMTMLIGPWPHLIKHMLVGNAAYSGIIVVNVFELCRFIVVNSTEFETVRIYLTEKTKFGYAK